MPRMFDLSDVLELVDDGFDDEAFAQENPVREQHKLSFHVLVQ